MQAAVSGQRPETAVCELQPLVNYIAAMSEANQTPTTGQCLCGQVSFLVDGDRENILHCHCVNCRRLTGNFIAASRVKTSDVVFASDTTLRWYELGYAKYGFCSGCGSTLFFVPEDDPEQTSITAGTFDDVSDLELGGVWFTADAQAHNTPLPSGVPHFEGNG